MESIKKIPTQVLMTNVTCVRTTSHLSVCVTSGSLICVCKKYMWKWSLPAVQHHDKNQQLTRDMWAAKISLHNHILSETWVKVASYTLRSLRLNKMWNVKLPLVCFVRTSLTQPTFIQPTFCLFLGSGPITSRVYPLPRFNLKSLFSHWTSSISIFLFFFLQCGPRLCFKADKETDKRCNQWANQWVCGKSLTILECTFFFFF